MEENSSSARLGISNDAIELLLLFSLKEKKILFGDFTGVAASKWHMTPQENLDKT